MYLFTFVYFLLRLLLLLLSEIISSDCYGLRLNFNAVPRLDV
jgi:hypothetical protein